MKALIERLKSQKLTIGSVESLTGGLFASELVSTSGASEVYLGSIVSYANVIKENLLNIDKEIISQHGVVSQEIATLMAKEGSLILESDVTIAFTGNAGPDTLENKAVGLVYMCVKINNNYFNYCDQLKGSRNKIRNDIVNLGIERLIKLIEEKGEK